MFSRSFKNLISPLIALLLSLSSAQAQDPPPITVRRAIRASPAAGQLMRAGSVGIVQHQGLLSLDFPWNAGRYTAYSCTSLRVDRLAVVGGGLQIDLSLDQVFLCPVPFRVDFKLRPRTNENTQYRLRAQGGTTATLTGTIGGVSAIGGATYAAVSEGQIEVAAPTGQRVTLGPGQMAQASETGIFVGIAPTPEARFERWGTLLRVNTHPTNRVVIDGREARQAYSPRVVEIASLAGEVRVYRVPPLSPRGFGYYR